MKATDLRIGNLVYYAGIVCKVSGYHNDDYLHTNGVTAPVASFQPIELTEEWLLKMGFTKSKDSFNAFYLELFDDVLNIKYVHQLQNLYHALTGEELTIK